jgi:hypothetical protein
MQLTRPLDFVAITDHAEGFGTSTHCNNTNLSLGERAACWLTSRPNPAIFKIFSKPYFSSFQRSTPAPHLHLTPFPPPCFVSFTSRGLENRTSITGLV